MLTDDQVFQAAVNAANTYMQVMAQKDETITGNFMKNYMIALSDGLKAAKNLNQTEKMADDMLKQFK